MDKDSDSLLTPTELSFTLIASMVGIGALTLPIDTVKIAKQDAWISCIIGAVYPLYMIFIANYMSKNFPKENILKLSKKYLGKVIGSILNVIYVIFFLLFVTEVSSGMANVLKIYMTWFLPIKKIIIVLLLPAAFVAYRGIKTLGRVNEVIFYMTVACFFIPIAALSEGSILNMQPVFGSGATNIIKASKETALAYSGIEIIFLIYPFIEENKKLRKAGIISVIVTMIIYTWFVFISIFYIGINVIPKFLWPAITMTESVVIPIINNFRFIFMSMWTLIMIKTLSNSYYGFAYGLSEMNKKLNRKLIVIIIFPLVFYLSTRYGNPTQRRNFLGKTIPIYVLFNIIYVSLIAILIKFKKGVKNEKIIEK